MYSTLASIGHEADISGVRSEEELRTARIFLGLHRFGITAEFGLSSISVPKRLLKDKKILEERARVCGN